MNFISLVNTLLKEEELSREDRIKALKSIPELKPVFKFNYVSWDWKESQPNEELERFNNTEKFPFEYETSLGSDAYFVFFSDIRLSERDCIALSLVPCYDQELRDEGKAEYLKNENAYVSYVSLEELKKAIEELD
jgi:hypothetical protein